MKFSVIIPVYRVEKYLRKCLESLLHQTCGDWEAVCIDDGSPDSSGQILDEFARLDSRFVVVHQENGGVSCARNTGLTVAKGEWVLFVDADDWIDQNYFERIENEIMSHPFVDCFISGFTTEGGNVVGERNSLFFDRYDQLPGESILSYGWCERAELDSLLWNKVFCLKRIKDIRFVPEMRHCEDIVYTYQCLSCCSSVLSLPNFIPYHLCRSRPDSATKTKRLEDYLTLLIAANELDRCADEKHSNGLRVWAVNFAWDAITYVREAENRKDWIRILLTSPLLDPVLKILMTYNPVWKRRLLARFLLFCPKKVRGIVFNCL